MFVTRIVAAATLSLVLTLGSAQGQEAKNKLPWQPNLGEARKKAKRQTRPLMVFVCESVSYWTAAMEKATFPEPSVARVLQEKFVAVKVMGDKRDESLKPLKIVLFPTIFFESSSGEVLSGKHEGYQDAKTMLRILTNVHEQETAKSPTRNLPLPGEVFAIEQRTAFLIPSKEPAAGKPWVWYAPTLPPYPGDAEKWMFEKFTAAGIAIAGIDVGESYGSPEGRKHYMALYQELTKRGMSAKPMLLGRSRGGLMLLSWAADNPEKTSGFAGIYPVCNLASYPGIDRAAPAYRMTPMELKAKLTEHNPLDRLAPLAKAKVPLFAIHGDVDKVVPLEANSGDVAKRYRELGGTMQLIVPPNQGHNMWPGFFRCEELVAFVVKQAK